MNTTSFADLSPTLQLGVGALLTLQLLLMVLSFVVLVRMRTGAIIGVPRWLWAIVIFLGQIFGSLVFLLAARMEKNTRRERAAFRVSAAPPATTIITDLYRMPEQ